MYLRLRNRLPSLWSLDSAWFGGGYFCLFAWSFFSPCCCFSTICLAILGCLLICRNEGPRWWPCGVDVRSCALWRLWGGESWLPLQMDQKGTVCLWNEGHSNAESEGLYSVPRGPSDVMFSWAMFWTYLEDRLLYFSLPWAESRLARLRVGAEQMAPPFMVKPSSFLPPPHLSHQLLLSSNWGLPMDPPGRQAPPCPGALSLAHSSVCHIQQYPGVSCPLIPPFPFSVCLGIYLLDISLSFGERRGGKVCDRSVTSNQKASSYILNKKTS